MTKLLLSAVVILCAFVLLPSCQKEVLKTEVVREITIDTTVTANSDYLLQLHCYGDEGDVATIVDKPSFATISRLENETDMFTSVYHYKPKSSAVGKTEKITLTISRGAVKDFVVIYLNVTVIK